MGHTNGPWKKVAGYGCKVINGKEVSGYTTKEICCTSGLPNEEEDLANAHLIASAPELLEALAQLIDRLDFHGGIDLIREEGPIEDARNAIAKAEGSNQ